MTHPAPDDQPKHEKIVKRIPQEDGSVKIVTESYFDDLTFASEEHEKQFKTSRESYIADVAAISSKITKEGASEINFRVKAKNNAPHLIIAKWLIKRQSFGRR